MKQYKISAYWFLIPFLAFMLMTGWLLQKYGKDDLFLLVNTNHHPVADNIFKYLTHLGDGYLYIGIIVLFLFISKRWFYQFLAAFLCSSIVARLGKDVIFEGMYRPKKYFELKDTAIRLIDDLKIHEYDTFPSGHTITAFSLYLMLALYFNQRFIALICFCIAAMVGFSRIYLAQHFPSDVYFGALFSVVVTGLSFYWLEKTIQKGKITYPDMPVIRI